MRTTDDRSTATTGSTKESHTLNVSLRCEWLICAAAVFGKKLGALAFVSGLLQNLVLLLQYSAGIRGDSGSPRWYSSCQPRIPLITKCSWHGIDSPYGVSFLKWHHLSRASRRGKKVLNPSREKIQGKYRGGERGERVAWNDLGRPAITSVQVLGSYLHYLGGVS